MKLLKNVSPAQNNLSALKNTPLDNIQKFAQCDVVFISFFKQEGIFLIINVN